MDIKSLIIGKSSENGKSVATKLSNRLKHIEKLVSDSDVKSVIKSLEGSLDIKPKYPGLRMDAIIDGIGIVCVMGNMQAIGTRCFSSLYYKNKGVINEQIFVSHSPANAWQHEYKDGKTCKPSNGNRITSIDLRKMIDEIYALRQMT